MKRSLFNLLILGLLLILGSCIYTSKPLSPRPEPWLCSINADGTGFRRIKKVDLSFGTTGFWDIYMTKDDRIIFYGEKLWISDTDSINVVQMTPDNLSVFNKPQLEFTQDGGAAYFAASRDLYKIKLSTNEVFKITETPEDYYWAEPVLSDNEELLTMRGYTFKGKEPRQAGVYIDLHDNSLKYIYSNTWFPGPYKTKLMNGLNCQILENRDGFASVCLLDSTYTLHLPYVASYKNMFETSADQRYILTRYKQSSSYYAIAIDLSDFSQHELGMIYEHSSSNPIKACKDTNLVYFRDENNVYLYDLNNNTKSTVIGPGNDVGVFSIYMHAPTWDGSKIYFYADISLQ